MQGFYSAMTKAVDSLYHQPGIMELAAPEEPNFEFNKGVVDEVLNWLHKKGKFTPEMLSEQPAKKLINETYRVLSSSIGQDVLPELRHALENNAFIFSGFKGYHTLNELGLYLTDDKGDIKPFKQFAGDVVAINNKYNLNYLDAEYNHAVHASQMAVKWHDFQQDGDRYNLQYRTAGDDKVRADHAVLHGTTLPPDDPFWSMYLPPNGWRCRCNVVQVRKNKYPTSDSNLAIEAGNRATETAKMQIFRFNPGKTLELFPPKHPYYKAPIEVEKEILKQAEQKPVITTKEEVWNEIRRINEETKWFENGFGTLAVEMRRGRNGSTNMRGDIWLTNERMNLCISGMDKLKRRLNIDEKEADALATFWHEITHNRNKSGMTYLTDGQRWKMELANEFVARNSLPEFYEAMGNKIQHPGFIHDRQSTGYNRYVRNYCTIIEKTGANYDKVLEDVRQHLFNQPINAQEAGLVDALLNNGAKKINGGKFKRTEIKEMIKLCRVIPEEYYYEHGIKSFIE